MNPCVYIMSNKPKGVLYIGMTTDLARRIEQHLGNHEKSFVSKYKLYTLVYVENHETIVQAAEREKQMKEWRRQWKIELIEKSNPHWSDLKNDARYFA